MTTYTRDSYTGLDYADQRYYASTYGRFNTPDPSASSAKAVAPGSWNRYAYVAGDPVNRNDRRGTDCSDLFADASQPYDPYSPCSGAPDDSCLSTAMAMALFQDDPDAATFEAQAAAMGCGEEDDQNVAQPYQPPLPTCDIQERDFTIAAGKVHTYYDVTIDGISSILEGIHSNNFGNIPLCISAI